MKRVVSISLGSPKRDHSGEIELLGERIKVERIGTNGDLAAAAALLRELDGKVDAFGLGGIDLYIFAGNRRYTLRDAAKIATAATRTPVVDGSGLKNTLERRVVSQVAQQFPLRGEHVLLVSGVDRQGMAESLNNVGCKVTYGDLMFALGLPIPLRSLEALRRVARIVAPVVSQLPFKLLYPTGSEQEQIKPGYARYYRAARVIAGDFHFIRRYLPPSLEGKIILTNTITEADIRLLGERGADTLITTTPELGGRSFGTNVLEAVLVAFKGANEQLTPEEYQRLLEQLKFAPRIVRFKAEAQPQHQAEAQTEPQHQIGPVKEAAR